MGIIKSHFAEVIEQRAAWQNSRNDNEFFEELNEGGVNEITWSDSLNNDYATWQYLNLK